MRRLIVGLMMVSAAVAVSSCGKATPPPAEKEKPAAAAPARSPAATAATMAGHFGKVGDIEEAIVRGDLDAANASGRWIAEHQDPAGLPAGTEPYLAETRNAATAVAASTSLANAGMAAAFAVAACGQCHAASKVTPKMPPPAAPLSTTGVPALMRAHQQALDLMRRGLIGPSDALWKQGAEALRSSPLTDKDTARLPKDIAAFQVRVAELAWRAAKANDAGGKIAIYGELMGGCATCHAAHGRVLGAGTPKTD